MTFVEDEKFYLRRSGFFPAKMELEFAFVPGVLDDLQDARIRDFPTERVMFIMRWIDNLFILIVELNVKVITEHPDCRMEGVSGNSAKYGEHLDPTVREDHTDGLEVVVLGSYGIVLGTGSKGKSEYGECEYAENCM